MKTASRIEPWLLPALKKMLRGKLVIQIEWRFNRPIQRACIWASLLLMFLSSGARVADVKAETLKAWDDYLAAANAQMQQRMSAAHPFLLADEDPAHAAKLRNGEILVFPAAQHIPKRVPSGLIHDWYGEVFIPDVTLLHVVQVLRGYERYKDVFKPVVVDSRIITSSESQDQFYMLLVNESLISKTALDIDYRSSYFRLGDRRGYKISQSTRIQELAGYGTDHQRMLPPDQGTGLIWRAFDITRFEERDGGTYIEVEEIVLSRDIPASLRWIVDPIVRRVSRGSVTTSLRQIRDAARLAPRRGEQSAECGRCFIGPTCVVVTPPRLPSDSFSSGEYMPPSAHWRRLR